MEKTSFNAARIPWPLFLAILATLILACILLRPAMASNYDGGPPGAANYFTAHAFTALPAGGAATDGGQVPPAGQTAAALDALPGSQGAEMPFRPEAPPARLQSPESLYETGYAFLGAGDYPNAADYFRAVADNYPGSEYYEGSMYNLAKCYRGMSKLSDAGAIFESLIVSRRASSSRPDWYFELASVRHEAMEFAGEASCYDRFVREYPSHGRASEAIFLSACAFESAFDNQAAIERYRVLLANHPYSPFAERARQRLAAFGH